MADAFSLRPYRVADHSTLIAWVADADELYTFAGGSLTWPLDAAQLDRIEALPDVSGWMAMNADGEPFGHLDIVRVDAEQARLARVIVAPSFRGRGLARPMIVAAVQLLRDQGYRLATLHVVPGNVPALRSYEGAGFRATAPVPGRGEFVRMELRLDDVGEPGARLRT